MEKPQAVKFYSLEDDFNDINHNPFKSNRGIIELLLQSGVRIFAEQNPTNLDIPVEMIGPGETIQSKQFRHLIFQIQNDDRCFRFTLNDITSILPCMGKESEGWSTISISNIAFPRVMKKIGAAFDYLVQKNCRLYEATLIKGFHARFRTALEQELGSEDFNKYIAYKTEGDRFAKEQEYGKANALHEKNIEFLDRIKIACEKVSRQLLNDYFFERKQLLKEKQNGPLS